MRDLRHRWIACTLLTLVTSSCAVTGTVGDKAGGLPAPVVLQLATVSSGLDERPPIKDFIKRVDDLSAGNVRVEVRYNWGGYAPNAEQQIVRAVGEGTIDLGVLGSRAFDTMGLDAFEALTAPMLIESYALENAVIRSDIGPQMLASVDPLHVTGLALIANGLREPVGVGHPLLGPATWRGLAIGTYPSVVQEEAIRALGAVPRIALGPVRGRLLTAHQIQGFEFNLLPYDINRYWEQARYITANITLWPQVDVLVANPGVLERLTLQQRDWLDEAAADASDVSAAVMARAEAPLVRVLCGRRTRFAEASPSDLASLRQAFAPVYSDLEADPRTRSFIARIEAMRRATPAGAPLAVSPSCIARST